MRGLQHGNYDLPWNPNRIEQRFGRIHRIGQTETCHLWNLVADGTREGEVFARLLTKIERQSRDFGGQVFDVLGEAFEDAPLRELLLEAIRYSDRPDVRARLDQVIDATVGDGVEQLLRERALHARSVQVADTAQLARQLELAQARRLQPHYLRAFFHAAFERLGGRISAREAGRHEITRVPARARRRGAGRVLDRYERVCFERDDIRRPGRAVAELLAPGHPLLDAVVDLTIEDLGSTLARGAVLFDAESAETEPRLLVASTEEIQDGTGRTVSRRFSYTELMSDGEARPGGPAPYLDYGTPPAGVADEVRWPRGDAEEFAAGWARTNTLPLHVDEVRRLVTERVSRTRAAVTTRLRQEISHWDSEAARLKDLLAAGRTTRMRPETAYRRARQLESRLERRMASLDLEETLVVQRPRVRGAALVVPAGLALAAGTGAGNADVEDGPGGAAGCGDETGDDVDPAARRAGPLGGDTEWVERRAVEAVLAAERALGAEPVEMPHNNPGFDVRSVRTDGSVVQIEVKGRIAGATDFTVTKNEVNYAKNLGESHRLAMVAVSPEAAPADRLRYVSRAFDDTDTDDFTTTKYVKHWRRLWDAGTGPH